ncbi:MAG: OmpA family protein [Saprospiraceae bacterium]|nr:OmpA family protein [Saprospiraceae bacterium]
MAFDLKQYSVAIEMLTEEYEDFTDDGRKGRIAFLLGKSYEKTLNYPLAGQWFKKAYEHKYGPEALKNLGLQLKNQERYQDAMSVFKEMVILPDYKVFTDRELLICKEAARWKSEPEPLQIRSFFETDGYSHFSPVNFENKFLIITSDRQEANGKNMYSWTGEKYSDLFLFSKTGDFIAPFDPVINSEANEGTPCFTKDFNTIFFTRCQRENPENDDCKLMVSYFLEGAWSEPEDISFTKPKVQYGHPTLMENDSVLIFASDLNEPGGNFDLFYSELLENNIWSDPYPMPRSINTDGNEKFPVSYEDTLFFCSDFLPGMGGLDIFKTYLRKDNTWSNPINLKYPLNSGADDFSLSIDKDFKPDNTFMERGYFSSSRSLKGIEEIYEYTRFKKQEVKPEPEPDKKPFTWFIGGKTMFSQYVNDDPNDEKLPDAILPETRVQLLSNEGILLEENNSNSAGIFLFKVDSGKKYIVKGQKLNYLAAIKEVDLTQKTEQKDKESETVNVNLILSKIYLNKEINLENIYYEFDQWNLTKEALPTLDILVNMMKANPNIKIQLNSHTDCRGDDDYNLDLSQKRAQSVVSYLVERGIPEDRLVAVGHGETKPNVLCICESCTEEDHQKNRRTSFTIISLKR